MNLNLIMNVSDANYNCLVLKSGESELSGSNLLPCYVNNKGIKLFDQFDVSIYKIDTDNIILGNFDDLFKKDELSEETLYYGSYYEIICMTESAHNKIAIGLRPYNCPKNLMNNGSVQVGLTISKELLSNMPELGEVIQLVISKVD